MWKKRKKQLEFGKESVTGSPSNQQTDSFCIVNSFLVNYDIPVLDRFNHLLCVKKIFQSVEYVIGTDTVAGNKNWKRIISK